MDNNRYEELYEKAEQHEQEHLFAFWAELSVKQQEHLLDQVEQINFSQINNYYSSPSEYEGREHVDPPRTIAREDISQEEIERGKRAIAAGKLAVVVVAGGQASRMGIDIPKGCYPISPIKKKTTFQLFAEKLLKAGTLYGAVPELYIMTSEENHQETIDYFEQNAYHGLDKNKVVFFPQVMYPVVDSDGQILLSDKHNICRSPGGHGGIYQALKDAQLFSRMRDKGIECLEYFQIDNPLAYLVDPAFIGAFVTNQADMATKVIEKAYPEERVGHVVTDGEKHFILEYIHLSEEMMYERDEKGDLLYKAANTAIHLLSRTFAEKIAEGNLPVYHAKKKMACIDEHGDYVTPLEPNAIKFESFVFDALPLANETLTLEVKRRDEFAPVKNARGRDSPDSAKDMMSNQGKRWLLAAGVKEKIVDKLDAVEISPLLAVTEDEFVQKMSPILKQILPQLQKKPRVYLS